MKKTIKILMVIILNIALLLSINPKTYAKDNPTIDDIVNLFNICTYVKKCNQEGSKNLAATKQVVNYGTSSQVTYLRVRVTDAWSIIDLDYQVNGTVLTADYIGGDTKIRQYWEEVTEVLVDCISQFHGYAEGEMFDTLKAPGIVNYTLAGEGLRIETNTEKTYYAQIDIARTIPTIDTNGFIKESDLESIANNIKGDGVAKYKKGNIIFYKCTINDKDIITIGELSDFTYKIDKSIFNIIQVMFESSEPAEYFKTNYATVDVDKQFKGFTVEVNPIKNDTEQYVFSGENNYKFVRITIDRKAVNEALNPTKLVATTPVEKQTDSSTPEPITPEPTTPVTTTPVTTSQTQTTASGTDTTEKLPKTGKEVNWGVMSLYGICGMAFIGTILIKLNKKEI